MLIHREDNPLEGSEVLFCQTLGAAFYGGKCTSALFMAPVGHLELVNLAFQTPSQQLFGEDVCNKHHTHTHTRAPPHTPLPIHFPIPCDSLAVLGLANGGCVLNLTAVCFMDWEL